MSTLMPRGVLLMTFGNLISPRLTSRSSYGSVNAPLARIYEHRRLVAVSPSLSHARVPMTFSSHKQKKAHPREPSLLANVSTQVEGEWAVVGFLSQGKRFSFHFSCDRHFRAKTSQP
jgi:glucose dehydrogenase